MDSPIKWHGGKHYFAKKFVALMPPHLHYVEPYAGSLAVLLERDPFRNWMGDGADSSSRGCSEVVNDINSELTNFWNVLINAFDEFAELVQRIPFSESAYQAAQAQCDGIAGVKWVTSVARASAFFVRCRQSMAGRMKCFAPLSRTRTRRGMNEQASAWMNAVDGLPAVHERLQQVVILNRDALDVIRQQDGEKTLFYLDPPYLHETRATTGEYEHEMTVEQHTELLLQLGEFTKGKFMLSGYRSELYDSHAARYGWKRHDFDAPNNAAGGKSKRRMTECLWTNF